MTTETTLVAFLLDRTGSMQMVKQDTIGAFNAYLAGLRAEGGGIRFSFLQFDSMSVDKVCVDADPKDVADLTEATYQPRASTPLIDAAFETIKAVERKATNGRKVVICIQTDGQENASVDHTWAELNALIKEKAALGWQFNFMGAGIDAYQQGAKMGIAAAATVSYDSRDPAATRAAFARSAFNHARFAHGLMGNTFYSAEQKMEAKDRFQPATPAPASGANQRTGPLVDRIDL